jgi:N-terminal acetyltransferase B complex non-catalytic subunit
VCSSSAFDGHTPISLEPSRLLNLLKHYFEVLGDKAACYEDLRSYIDLGSEELHDWITLIEKTTHTPVSFSKCRQLSAKAHVVLRYCSSPIHQCP